MSEFPVHHDQSYASMRCVGAKARFLPGVRTIPAHQLSFTVPTPFARGSPQAGGCFLASAQALSPQAGGCLPGVRTIPAHQLSFTVPTPFARGSPQAGGCFLAFAQALSPQAGGCFLAFAQTSSPKAGGS